MPPTIPPTPERLASLLSSSESFVIVSQKDLGFSSEFRNEYIEFLQTDPLENRRSFVFLDVQESFFEQLGRFEKSEDGKRISPKLFSLTKEDGQILEAVVIRTQPLIPEEDSVLVGQWLFNDTVVGGFDLQLDFEEKLIYGSFEIENELYSIEPAAPEAISKLSNRRTHILRLNPTRSDFDGVTEATHANDKMAQPTKTLKDQSVTIRTMILFSEAAAKYKDERDVNKIAKKMVASIKKAVQQSGINNVDFQLIGESANEAILTSYRERSCSLQDLTRLTNRNDGLDIYRDLQLEKMCHFLILVTRNTAVGHVNKVGPTVAKDAHCVVDIATWDKPIYGFAHEVSHLLGGIHDEAFTLKEHSQSSRIYQENCRPDGGRCWQSLLGIKKYGNILTTVPGCDQTTTQKLPLRFRNLVFSGAEDFMGIKTLSSENIPNRSRITHHIADKLIKDEYWAN